MNEAQIRQVASQLGFTLKPKGRSGWMEAPCPLAPWTHDKGYDTHPSFAIKINETGKSNFACQACHHKGSLATLAFKFFGFTQEERYQKLGYEIDEIEAKAAADNLPVWDDEDAPEEEIDRVFLRTADVFPKYDLAYHSRRCRDYLESRGIRPWTSVRLGLRYDAQLDRILFPVFDRNGDLRGLSGRALYDDAPIRIKDYYGLNKIELFLGEHRIFRDRHKLKFVVIVEGLFDYAKVFQAGLPVMALFGSNLTKPKFDKLIDLDLPVIWMTDNDEAGVSCLYGMIDRDTGERDNAKGALYRLDSYIPQLTTAYPKGGEDPGKLSEKSIRRMVERAELWLNAA